MAKSTTVKIREEIQNITTVDAVREYMTKLNLIEGQYADIKDNKTASKVTTAEYKYLYDVLYNTPIAASTRKDIIIGYIISYFASIDRAKALKP